MEIGAYFQCYKQPFATLRALASFRESYPNGTIVLVSDNGLNFSNMAKHFNCLYFHETSNTDKNWLLKNKETILNHLDRMRRYVSLIKEEYFMILEDDVLVVRRVMEPFLGDLNGNRYNPLQVDFLRMFPEIGKVDSIIPYTGHGGSIWNTKKFLEFISDRERIESVLARWETMYDKASEDILTTVLCLVSGGRIHHLSSHKDRITNNVTSLEGVAIVHQMKDLYSTETFDESIIY